MGRPHVNEVTNQYLVNEERPHRRVTRTRKVGALCGNSPLFLFVMETGWNIVIKSGFFLIFLFKKNCFFFL